MRMSSGKIIYLILLSILSIILFRSYLIPSKIANAEANCSLNIYPEPIPGTHRYTVTLTNNTSTPIYYFVNNFWFGDMASGNPTNATTSPDNYWNLGTGLGYSVGGWAGKPINQGQSMSYEVDLTFTNAFNGVDLGVSGKESGSYDVCNQPHGSYEITYSNLELVPTPVIPPNPTPIPITPSNCSLNIYPEPIPGTHRYTVTLTNNAPIPGYKFINNYWVDGAPSGHPDNTSTSSDWHVSAPVNVLSYQVGGTAGTALGEGESLTYQTDLTIGNTFNGVDIGLYSIYSGVSICSQGHGAYAISYNNPDPNLSPILGDIEVSMSPILLDQSVVFTSNFTDQNISDSHTAIWDWGDGAFSSGIVVEDNGSGVVSGAHAYTTSGTYIVTLSLSDNDGAADMKTYQLIVQTPSEAVDSLVDKINDLNLENGVLNSLDGKLNAVLNALEDLNENNDHAAINSLYAFIDKVEQRRGSELMNEEADVLIATAQAIINFLSL